MVLSSSVSLPSISIRTCLPQSKARSRTTRGNLLQIVADRLHAGLHHPFLQLGRDQIQSLGRAEKRRVFQAAGELQHLVAGQHQLADAIHQLVEQARRRRGCFRPTTCASLWFFAASDAGSTLAIGMLPHARPRRAESIPRPGRQAPARTQQALLRGTRHPVAKERRREQDPDRLACSLASTSGFAGCCN